MDDELEYWKRRRVGEEAAELKRVRTLDGEWYARYCGAVYYGQIVAPNGDEYGVEDADEALALVKLLNEAQALRKQARSWERRARELEYLCEDRL